MINRKRCEGHLLNIYLLHCNNLDIIFLQGVKQCLKTFL